MSDPVEFPKVTRELAPAPQPPPLPGADNDVTIAELAALPSIPTVSIAPDATNGTHVISLAPHTKLENYGPSPTAMTMFWRVSPFNIAIAGFVLWGAMGKAEPAAAAGFITAFVLACLNAKGGGPTLGAIVVDGAKKLFGKLGKKEAAK